ncbi:MAG: DUF4249 domain-containing protein [Flavihumibacter sp.]|nr:DUF4249 domain-containing protein [Flavihumibacter sp.]
MRILLLTLIFLTTLVACERSVDFDLDKQEPKLVVEATIEARQAPLVFLSRSLDFFSEINPEILTGSFVRNAIVRISNGSRTHQLKEYSIPTPAGTIIYYSIDSSNLATAFPGVEGTSYRLEIEVDGKTYTATTTIPVHAKTVDSIWWKPSENNPDTNKVVLWARVTDPPGFGNYIRFFTSTNGGPFNPGFNSVFDDQIVDGSTYDIQVEQGINRNEEIDFETYSFFDKGDTVILKFTNIDKSNFDFWRTMEYNYGSIGSPFGNPTKVLSNISGGALGYFGGYSVQYDTLVIPR